ncbi:MAG: hypothetical protein WBD31_00385 [Rubripirellula sp.]
MTKKLFFVFLRPDAARNQPMWVIRSVSMYRFGNRKVKYGESIVDIKEIEELERLAAIPAWIRNSRDVLDAIVNEFEGEPNRVKVHQLALKLAKSIKFDDIAGTMQSGDGLRCVDPDAHELSETSYRRGYMGGYSHALDAICDGKTIEDCNSYMNEDLIPWREGDCTKQEVPPMKDS